ncbi:MAG: YfcC family protein [Ignavibacteriaceae bacterium]
MSSKKFKLKVPNTYILIFSLLVIFVIMTWIIPGGEYQRAEVNGREVVIPNSFKYTDSNPQSVFDLFIAPIRGFVDGSMIIGFILLVGGSFNVLQKTQAIDKFIHRITKAYNKSKTIEVMMIPLLITLFSLAGATFGMNEEIIPFIIVFVPLALALGYDSIIGVAIPLVGAHIGFASAFLNPFNVGIAQGISEVPLFSGIEYRLIVWFIINAVTVLFIVLYANKVKKNPEISPVYELDLERRIEMHLSTADNNEEVIFSARHKIVLYTFLLSLLTIVYGVIYLQWFIEEIAGVFFIMGLITGIIGGLRGEEIVKGFIEGAKDLVGTAFILALARGTVVIAQDGLIIDTILYKLAPFVESSNPVFASQKMFVIQAIINFFIHSGSGQAALTMPIMAPLSDLVGVSRQTAILAFQFGELTNIIIPTSAVTMGALSMGKIPYNKWAKWVLPLTIILAVLALILLIPPFLIQWQ